MNNLIANQILYAFESLATPYGILMIAALVLLLGITLTVPPLKGFLLGAMLCASTLSLSAEAETSALAFPLQQLRWQGRPLTIAFMVLLLISLLLVPNSGRKKILLGGTVWFFVFQIAMSLRELFGGLFARGGPEFVIYILLFLTLALALSRSLRAWSDCLSLVHFLAGTAIAFVILNIYDFVLKPGSTFVGNRFRGITGNPQHVAAFAALLMLPMLYLLARPGRNRFSRVWLAIFFSPLVVMLLWTASRTGLLMGLVGVGFLFRRRLSRLAGVGIIVSILVMLILNFSSGHTESPILYSRLVSTMDTRSYVWSSLLHQFIESPVVGILPIGEIGIAESSYLSVAARFGLLGLIPLVLSIALIGTSLLKLHRVSRFLPDSMMADLVIAGLAQIFVGGISEGFLAGTLTIEIFMIYCYLTMAAFLLEYAELPQLEDETIEELLPLESKLVPGGF